MKPSVLTGLTAAALCVVLTGPRILAQEQPAAQEENSEHARYKIVDLGPVGIPPGAPYDITNNGLIAGAAPTREGAMHAVLWFNRVKIDIGKPGLGGPRSAGFGINRTGQVVGAAETSDLNYEDFCGFNAYGLPHSDSACLPFLWQDGVMNPLPTLGGANGVASRINAQGLIAGYAENSVPEPGCAVSQFKPVVWKGGAAYPLPTFKGDPVGVAAWVNDKGQVVGSSGTCAAFNPNSGLYMVENHALLWKNGKVIDLGNLGGTGGIAGNHACAINNRGQVVGHSELPNDTTFHGFLWTKERGRMLDLGTLDGDVASLGLDIDDGGTVVGASLDASFTPRAIVWKNGVMTDLNTLIRGHSALPLLLANSINDRGEIVGLGATSSGLHGFLATRCDRDRDDKGCCGDERCEDADVHSDDTAAEPEASAEPTRPVLSESARQLLQQQLAERFHVGGLQ
jgi:probable HAF family extracellular repeat protein